MMLDHCGHAEQAVRIERAVVECLRDGECTVDVGGDLGTAATGDAVVRHLLREGS
jgi:isocitrate/isopropylmalate dehydrogenase